MLNNEILKLKANIEGELFLFKGNQISLKQSLEEFEAYDANIGEEEQSIIKDCSLLINKSIDYKWEEEWDGFSTNNEIYMLERHLRTAYEFIVKTRKNIRLYTGQVEDLKRKYSKKEFKEYEGIIASFISYRKEIDIMSENLRYRLPTNVKKFLIEGINQTVFINQVDQINHFFYQLLKDIENAKQDSEQLATLVFLGKEKVQEWIGLRAKIVKELKENMGGYLRKEKSDGLILCKEVASKLGFDEISIWSTEREDDEISILKNAIHFFEKSFSSESLGEEDIINFQAFADDVEELDKVRSQVDNIFIHCKNM